MTRNGRNGAGPPVLDAQRDELGRFRVGNTVAVGRPLGSLNRLSRVSRAIIAAHASEHLKSALDETRANYPHLYSKFMLQYFRPYRAEIAEDEENGFQQMKTVDEVIEAMREEFPAELIKLIGRLPRKG